MLSRLSKRREDEGFTLIELLVVIIIIGILAAIAIPVFLRQRENAWNAAVQADLRNAATAQETYLTQEGTYSAESPVDGDDAGFATTDLAEAGFKFSGDENYLDGNRVIVVTADGGNEYCLEAVSAAGGAGGTTWSYSSPGGLQEQACQ